MLLKKIATILTIKFWDAQDKTKQKQLFQLLIIWFIISITSTVLIIVHFISPNSHNCIICDILLLAISILTVVCLLNAKRAFALNVVFLIPIIIYGYSIADISVHLPPIETVHYSAWLFMAGLVYLYLFTRSESKIALFALISFIFIGYELYLDNHLFDSFSYFEPVVTNPLLIFAAFFLSTFYLRKKIFSLITKQEEQLKQNNESINRVLQNSSFLIAKLSAKRDEDGNVVQLIVDKVNNAFESVFKLHLYEVQGQEAEYVFNLIFKGLFDVNKIVFFNKRKVSEFHARNLDKWFKVHVLNTNYNLFYVALEDITKTKKKIAKLEASERRYKVLLEAIPDIFFVIDKDGIYEDFVIKESDLFKMKDANIIGSSIYNAGFPDNMATKIYSYIQHCIKNNSIETIEYSLSTPNGTFIFEMRLAKLNAHSVISVARDITKRKTTEFALEKALNRAEESDKLKSAFLGNLSHEIHTPINIITNFTRMLADPDMDDTERLELTDGIIQNGLQLVNMIDNTVHLSKIETEELTATLNFCKTNLFLRDIYNKVSPNIPDSKDIELKLNTAVANAEFGFETDNDLLSNAIFILVDNAVKYTNTGLVRFGYEMIRSDKIKFFVSDTGIGIPEEDFENIFSRFFRVQNNINQTTSGSGIGLAIAQHYISVLGGELEFDSNVGQGSNFWFTLPFKNGQGYMKIMN